jgi:hypothetical protein
VKERSPEDRLSRTSNEPFDSFLRTSGLIGECSVAKIKKLITQDGMMMAKRK